MVKDFKKFKVLQSHPLGHSVDDTIRPEKKVQLSVAKFTRYRSILDRHLVRTCWNLSKETSTKFQGNVLMSTNFLHSISMHSISAGLPEAVGGGVPTWDINWAQFTSGWSKLMSHSSIQVESSPPHWESRDPQAPLSWALTLPRPHHPPRQRGQPEPVRERSSDNCLHYRPSYILNSRNTFTDKM